MVIVSKLDSDKTSKCINEQLNNEITQEEVEAELVKRKEGEFVKQDYEFVDHSNKIRYGYYLDQNLKFNLDNYFVKAVAKKWDGNLLVAGMEGCLTGDTPIQTNKGIKKIESINSRNIVVKAVDIIKNKIVDTHATITKTGVKKVFKIKTKQGNYVEASKEHRFFVQVDGKIIEKKVFELKTGDKLLCTK